MPPAASASGVGGSSDHRPSAPRPGPDDLSRPADHRAGSQLRGTPAGVIERYLHHLEGERGLAHNSVLAYRRDLRRYCDHLSACGLSSLGAVGEAEVAGFAAVLR
ncbi:site-specific integrase, partial [Frankia sp. CcWB2]